MSNRDVSPLQRVRSQINQTMLIIQFAHVTALNLCIKVEVTNFVTIVTLFLYLYANHDNS